MNANSRTAPDWVSVVQQDRLHNTEEVSDGGDGRDERVRSCRLC